MIIALVAEVLLSIWKKRFLPTCRVVPRLLDESTCQQSFVICLRMKVRSLERTTHKKPSGFRCKSKLHANLRCQQSCPEPLQDNRSLVSRVCLGFFDMGFFNSWPGRRKKLPCSVTCHKKGLPVSPPACVFVLALTTHVYLLKARAPTKPPKSIKPLLDSSDGLAEPLPQRDELRHLLELLRLRHREAVPKRAAAKRRLAAPPPFAPALRDPFPRSLPGTDKALRTTGTATASIVVAHTLTLPNSLGERRTSFLFVVLPPWDHVLKKSKRDLRLHPAEIRREHGAFLCLKGPGAHFALSALGPSPAARSSPTRGLGSERSETAERLCERLRLSRAWAKGAPKRHNEARPVRRAAT